MQGHVQEGIGFAQARMVVAGQVAFGLIQYRVVFRMLLDDLGDESFQGFHGRLGLVFLPRLEKHLTELIAVLTKHWNTAETITLEGSF